MAKWVDTNNEFGKDLVTRLYESDEASALTNQAAREIERLREVIIKMTNDK